MWCFSQTRPVTIAHDRCAEETWFPLKIYKLLCYAFQSFFPLSSERIADVNLNEDKNAVQFELISNEELHGTFLVATLGEGHPRAQHCGVFTNPMTLCARCLGYQILF